MEEGERTYRMHINLVEGIGYPTADEICRELEYQLAEVYTIEGDAAYMSGPLYSLCTDAPSTDVTNIVGLRFEVTSHSERRTATYQVNRVQLVEDSHEEG